jgi:hypothetical protein
MLGDVQEMLSSLSRTVMHLPFFRLVICILLLLSLPGCGYMWQKAHGTDQLLQLSGQMSQQQVRAILGNPDSIAYDEKNIAILRYRLYDSHRMADDFPWLFIVGWIGPGTLYPLSNPDDYFVAFKDDELCNWERGSRGFTIEYGAAELAKDVRQNRLFSYCKEPRIAKQPATQKFAKAEIMKSELAITNMPIYMPPRISGKISRLAVLPLSDGGGYAVATWIDLALNILRQHHPEIVLVDRDLRPVMNEVLLQHSGRISDETTVRVGRLVGANSLITYNVEPLPQSGADDLSRYGGPVTGFVELKLVSVEEGTVLFRQRAMATAQVPAPNEGLWPQSILLEGHRKAVNEASYFALSALLSAFGDNPLGIVPDMKERDSVKLLGVLDGSPAHIAGLRKGDRISLIDGQPINAWTSLMPHSLPTTLTLEREGAQREITVARA